jgi:peptidoglycan/xylan/chitin deacetylase (PgdA/CDA1 family)
MTFDDGPSVGNTARLLDILKQRNIKVTFFMIGPNVVAHPEIARRVLAEGHEIGNHSWTHPQLSKLSDQRVTEEILRRKRLSKTPPDLPRQYCDHLTEQSRSVSVSGLKISSDDAMPATLDALLAKGFKFLTVTELIAMNHPKPQSSPSAVSLPQKNEPSAHN